MSLDLVFLLCQKQQIEAPTQINTHYWYYLFIRIKHNFILWVELTLQIPLAIMKALTKFFYFKYIVRFLFLPTHIFEYQFLGFK